MPQRKSNSNAAVAMKSEGQALLAAVPQGALVIALDQSGKQWSTEGLANKLESWMHEGRDVAFLIGGPDGLSRTCLDNANMCWSLGRGTFPHAMVRVMVAEQLYRAWSVTQNHPYHRA